MAEVSENFWVASLSGTGSHHPRNQDSFLGLPGESLFGVADGVSSGLHSDGASRLTLLAFREYWRREGVQVKDAGSFLECLREGGRAVQQVLLDWIASHPSYQESGSGMTLLVCWRDLFGVVHVGDSVLYLYRDGRLSTLTEKHCVTLDSGREVLSQAFGYSGSVQAQVRVDSLKKRDLFLILTDGISAYVGARDIERLFSQRTAAMEKPEALEDICRWVDNCAVHRGSQDDRTAVLVSVRG